MDWSIDQRNVIVTGGTSGIGKAVATALAAEGARVTITSRSRERADAAALDIERTLDTHIEKLIVDFSDLESVRNAATEYRTSHDDLAVLVNNAGVVMGSTSRTVDGYETTFATNHLGPFLLTSHLLELLETSAPSRIINTSSVAHTYAKDGIVFDDLNFDERHYRFMEVYGHSKLANILHAHEINTRYGDKGISAAAVHPGIVRTGLGSGGTSWVVGLVERVGGRWMKTPENGADTIVWLATKSEIDIGKGIYFEDRHVSKSTRHARDADQALKLWDVSERLTGLDAPERGES
ncbi:MAG: SDR family NAD(P)-dependent oxidoreductase [Acidimicrobiia bacterium]